MVEIKKISFAGGGALLPVIPPVYRDKGKCKDHGEHISRVSVDNGTCNGYQQRGQQGSEVIEFILSPVKNADSGDEQEKDGAARDVPRS